jgi:hypothetical protein
MPAFVKLILYNFDVHYSTLTNELNCILPLDTVVGKQLHEFCLELCSLCFRILQYGICFWNLFHWQMAKTVSNGRKGGMLMNGAPSFRAVVGAKGVSER